MDFKEVEDNLDAAVKILKALSNEKRLKIMCALQEGEKNVGELEAIIGLSQSALSQHLARLRKDGLVITRRHAQTIYYSPRNKVMDILLKPLLEICTAAQQPES